MEQQNGQGGRPCTEQARSRLGSRVVAIHFRRVSFVPSQERTFKLDYGSGYPSGDPPHYAWTVTFLYSLNGKRPCRLIPISMSPAYVFRAANMAESADAVRFVRTASSGKSSPWRPANLQSELLLCTVTIPPNRDHSLDCEITLFRGTLRLGAARHHPLFVDLQVGLPCRRTSTRLTTARVHPPN
jgi:hypothetical protein